jgi:hypothetical protein
VQRKREKTLVAHIEVVQTSSTVTTHIRGRVFRYAPMAKRKAAGRVLAVRSRERRRICVLDAEQAFGLEQFHRSLLCYGPGSHTHYTRDAVLKLIESGELRWVEGSGNNVAAWQGEWHWEGGQLVPGNSSKRGPNQHCQPMPQLSTAMGSQVAMYNDGRL